jgi:ZIP family zinc transporter
MTLLYDTIFVFFAGLITALATGLGAIPFFFVQSISTRWKSTLWGLAGGIMIAASVFGLILEAGKYGTAMEITIGILVGIGLVVLGNRLLENAQIDPKDYAEADYRKLILILGILTIHSFPEGVAVGVSFAELDFSTGISLLGLTVPVLGLFMTIAISIHNIPEGLSISIALSNLGISKWKMVGLAIFSSLPQPIGAVLAFLSVQTATQLLPIGFGFAAGAMIYLVFTEFIPEALTIGRDMPYSGYLETSIGFLAGIFIMLPFLFF